ncbi:putative nucleic acid-binding protein [Stenotrophomonas rhizophila]|uniref:Nucleic acid-binding protein n=2 Tax=Lysobacteraceae TaxID=32033 RepID=A0AAW5PKI5_9GAMM|nr:putative nucleic acid-binding protein [Stenotrophomonas rhizophila]
MTKTEPAMIAVDSPVLIELLSNGPQADAVEACLRQNLVGGRVVVCGATLAELCASLRGGAEVLEALEEMGVHFNALEAKSALRAGEMQRRHRQRGEGRRSLDDFMVGSHALLQCDGLITWNDKFYRDYFKGLKLIVPHA